MADVTMQIAGNRYTVSCRDGEENHLRRLGEMVNAKTEEARQAVGETLGEARIMLFAALLLADEADELRGKTADGDAEDRAEALAARLDALSNRLAPQNPDT